jgi:hypothetical protein
MEIIAPLVPYGTVYCTIASSTLPQLASNFASPLNFDSMSTVEPLPNTGFYSLSLFLSPSPLSPQYNSMAYTLHLSQ